MGMGIVCMGLSRAIEGPETMDDAGGKWQERSARCLPEQFWRIGF